MDRKKVRRPASYPGANLAKGWEDTESWARAWAKAERDLFRVIHEVTTYESKTSSDYLMKALARKWLGVATLEEVRALVMEMKGELGL